MENKRLTADQKFAVYMGKAPPRTQRDKGFNDKSASLARGDEIGKGGTKLQNAVTYQGLGDSGFSTTNFGKYDRLDAAGPARYEGQSMLSKQFAVRNRAAPQLAIERNMKFHAITNAKTATASLSTIEPTQNIQQASDMLKSASAIYPLNKMKIPSLPDRFKIRKKFYDNNLEFSTTLKGYDQKRPRGGDPTFEYNFANKDYSQAQVSLVQEAITVTSQLNQLATFLQQQMKRDMGMRQEYFDLPPEEPRDLKVNMNARGQKVIRDLLNYSDTKPWFKVVLAKDQIMRTEALSSSNAWYRENLYKKEIIGQSVKIGTPTYQITGSERRDLKLNSDLETFRVPMFAYVIVQYNAKAVKDYRNKALAALSWQNPLWDPEAVEIVKTQINNSAANYVAVLSPQYKSLGDKVQELVAEKTVIFKNYNATAQGKGRMRMDDPLSKMRFTDEAVQKTITEIDEEYKAVWQKIEMAKSDVPKPSWGQLRVKHADKLDSITIYYQDNHSPGNNVRLDYDQVRISCNLKEVALVYKAVVSPWVRQITLNHALMCQWKKHQAPGSSTAKNWLATKIYGDRGQVQELPKIMLSRPKYISFKKKKRNLYAAWLTLGTWISLANDPNTAAAMRFNAVINQDSYLLTRQLEGVLDTVIKASKSANDPQDLSHHAFHVLFARVVHKAEPGYKSAGIDGSRHAHYRLFDVGNTKGKYIRLNYANNAIGKKNVINLRARLRQFLRHMKKLNSVNQIFQTKPKDRGFNINMMEIAGNCVMMSMAAKFLPNHDFFTYIENDDMVEQVKGNSFNTVMQMMTMMTAQKATSDSLTDYVDVITKAVQEMSEVGMVSTRRSFVTDYLSRAQQKANTGASTAASQENTNPLLALSELDILVNKQSAMYNNDAQNNNYGQLQNELSASAKFTLNAVIRTKQLKQSTVAIIQKDLYLFQLACGMLSLPGHNAINLLNVAELVSIYDKLLRSNGISNFTGQPLAMSTGDGLQDGILAPIAYKGSQEFMDMIAYYRGFLEIMDSAGQLFTLYQLRVYKGATDEEFMAFLTYYLELSRQMMLKLIPVFTKLKQIFLWRSTTNGKDPPPTLTEAHLAQYTKNSLESTVFAGVEIRIIWGLEDMLGRIRQPSAAGQPSMRTIGYRMTTGSFPDAPLANIAAEDMYGTTQNIFITPNTTLQGYDGKSTIQPEKMGRLTQGGGNIAFEPINPRQQQANAPDIQPGMNALDLQMGEGA